MMPPTVLWELRGRNTGTPLSCELMLQADNLWQLSITMGQVKLHSETFRNQSDANTQSDFLRRDFLQEGWSDVFKADERHD
jgi:hypothetical protein